MPRPLPTAAPSTQPAPALTAQPIPAAHDPGTSVLLPVADIDPNPWNPRRFPARPDAEDQSLIASISRLGVQENLLVRPLTDGRYQLVFGERRLRAATAAGCTYVPAVVRDLDDHESRVLTITENLHRKQLTFIDEADAVGGLVDEHWTLNDIAAELGRPLSWVARRRRLLNLAPAWRKLAETRLGWSSTWSAADFEQIAILQADAQTDLLTNHRHQLERCASSRELAQLIRSLARAVSGFPWNLDDADLHPKAGACSACPHRSIHHPGLFDDQPPGDDLRGPTSPPAAADRCLNPLCAREKAQLFVDRKVANLAAKHPRVYRLQDGWLPTDIPGALENWQVTEVKRGARGAAPAVVANGPGLGRVKWIKPLPERLSPSKSPTPSSQPGKTSLAVRRERKDRQRKIHAIALLKAALVDHAPPDLSTTLRLAIVFGTAHTNSSASYTYDPALPRLTATLDPASERRRMLGAGPAGQPSGLLHLAFPDPPAAAISSSARPINPAPSGGAPASAVPPAQPAAPPSKDSPLCRDTQTTAESPATAAVCETAHHPPGPASGHTTSSLWHTFEALAGNDLACAELLWARMLPVLLDRITPNGDPRHVDLAWHEAVRTASLLHLDAQAFLDQATADLPDPKTWTSEAVSLTRTPTRAVGQAADTAATPISASPRTATPTPSMPIRRPAAAGALARHSPQFATEAADV
jgi:ParB/RepB/Spo0J family partition protein